MAKESSQNQPGKQKLNQHRNKLQKPLIGYCKNYFPTTVK
jgi:hypothetical protein